MEYVRDSNMEVYTTLVDNSIGMRNSFFDLVEHRIGFADSIEWSEDAAASPLALLSSGGFARDSHAQQDLGDRKTVEKQPQDSRTIEYTDKHQARTRLQQGEQT